MAYGITNAGFIRKTKDQITEELHAEAKLTIDADIDLTPYSPDGQLLEVMASNLDEMWQKMEDVYNANFLDTAEGIQLDRVSKLGGIERNKEKSATVLLKFSGSVEGAVVPAATICETAQGIQFQTISDCQLNSSEIVDDDTVWYCTVQSDALEVGLEGNVPKETIKTFQNQPADVAEVINPEPALGGRATETDWELRARYLERGTYGGSTITALSAALNDLDSVQYAVVYENSTSEDDTDARPPHSIEAVIDGGNPLEIGAIFLRYKPAGISTIGIGVKEEITLNDELGYPRSYQWSIPQQLNVFASVTIVPDVNFPAEGTDDRTAALEKVRKNVVRIIGGEYTPDEIFSGNGIGSDVYAWELIAAQAGMDSKGTERIEGIKNLSVTIWTENDATPVSQVVVSGREFAKVSDPLDVAVAVQ